MNDITRKDELPEEVAAKLHEHSVNWKVGDVLMGRYGERRTIAKIDQNEDGVVFVEYYEDGYEKKRVSSFADLVDDNRYIKIGMSEAELEHLAIRAMTDPKFVSSLDKYAGDDNVSETAVVAVHDNRLLEDVRESAIEVGRKTQIIIRKIEEMTKNVAALQSTMSNRLGYVSKVLDVLEAFTGVYEEIVCIKSGLREEEGAPISIRQLVMYMDEEAGVFESFNGDKGINWHSVNEFDKWLLGDPERIEAVIPEKKCIVALKPSRQRRADEKDWWKVIQDDKNNSKLYLLIRNGECLWRIWTGFTVGEKLFPSAQEFDDLLGKVASEKDKSREDYRYRGIELGWKRNIALIQGILERTDVLRPMKGSPNLFKPETYDGAFNIIRDAEAENQLTDGKPLFRFWQKEINSRIKRGDRIYLAPIGYGRISNDRFSWRFGGDYYHNPNPESGVYSVEGEKEAGYSYSKHTFNAYKILFRPTNYWGEGVSRRRSFFFKFDDNFILRYDDVGIDDLEYYINSRVERRDYLHILPFLCGVLEQKKKEKLAEDQFAKLLATRHNVSVSMVHELIIWWKSKVIMKRPLTSDDKKAWRMIEKQLRKQIDSAECVCLGTAVCQVCGGGDSDELCAGNCFHGVCPCQFHASDFKCDGCSNNKFANFGSDVVLGVSCLECGKKHYDVYF